MRIGGGSRGKQARKQKAEYEGDNRHRIECFVCQKIWVKDQATQKSKTGQKTPFQSMQIEY